MPQASHGVSLGPGLHRFALSDTALHETPFRLVQITSADMVMSRRLA